MNPKKWLRNHLRRAQLAWLGNHGRECAPRTWVFIVGCYNSGTTLLHDIIASHPWVAHLPREGQYCTDQLPIPSELGLARAWALQPERFVLPADADTPDFHRLQRQWCSLMSNPGAAVMVEKSIPNAARILWLDRHFPGARFIAIVRNGYAVAEGIRRKTGLPLETAARQWQQSNAIMLEQLNGLKNHLLVRYEDLTAEPQEQLQEILAFLQLELPENLADKSWTIHGVRSTIHNMNPGSLAALNSREIALIKAQAAPMLRRFQYTADA